MNSPALTVYLYDPTFGTYLSTARLWPEYTAHGETIYRLPKYSTLVEPDFPDKGYAAIFHEQLQKWSVVEDHRGETWRDGLGRSAEVFRLGNPIDWGWRPAA